MAYKPNPNREIVDGKAKVSAKELADFQSEYGKDKTLRDLLNADKGLSRAPEFGVNRPRNSSVKDDTQIVKREGATPSKAEAPKPRARSLVDQGRGVKLYETADTDAVLQAGLGLASVYPGTIAARTAYGVARPAIGAAAKYLSKKDSPASVADDIKDPSFNPEKMMDRRSTTFPGRSEPKFNPDKMTSRDRLEPELFKKGGKVSGASKRGDGIAQRGRTKGRFI